MAVPALTEIRWHARAGEGAKTASQILALALLRSGRQVQSFSAVGTPLCAYTRFATQPIHHRDSSAEPDLVVVLDDTLLDDPSVREGIDKHTKLLVVPPGRFDVADASIAMLGAVAAVLGEPTLAELEEAIVDVLGSKAPERKLRAAAEKGFAWQSRPAGAAAPSAIEKGVEP